MSVDDIDDFEDELVTEYRDLLEKVYHEFARRKDAPECLRELIYETIGRTLP